MNMTVEEGVKLVISGGIVSPPDQIDRSAPEDADDTADPQIQS